MLSCMHGCAPQVERKTIRQDREWVKNPQHPNGFEAKPRTLPDSTQDLLTWDCVIPGKAGTIWEGGRMPIVLTFTEDYPQEAPKAQFKPLPGTNTPLFPPCFATSRTRSTTISRSTALHIS